MFFEQRIKIVIGESLLCQKYPASRMRDHRGEDLSVRLEFFLIDNIAGSLKADGFPRFQER